MTIHNQLTINNSLKLNPQGLIIQDVLFVELCDIQICDSKRL